LYTSSVRAAADAVQLAGRERCGNRVSQLSGGDLRALQARWIGIRQRDRVQFGIHVAGIEGEHPHPFARELGIPDPAQMQERGFAGAISAPLRVGGDRCIADDVEDDGAAPLPRRGREGTEQSSRQTERAYEVRR
jgi:hypothetical protein